MKAASNLKKYYQYHLMLVPGTIITFIFCYIPLYGLVIAFQNYNPGTGFSSPWVGLDHFKFLFSQPNFMRTIWNTLSIASLKLVFSTLASVVVAILLNEMVSVRLKRFYQTLIYIPNFLSWIIIAGVIMDLLAKEGAINTLLNQLNLPTINFLGDARIFPWTMIVSDVWKNFGFGTVVYLAALTGIDPGLYESAILDGATRWQKIRHITLPLLVPTIILMTVLALGGLLNAGFDQIYNLYSPVVYESGDIIDTYVYRLGIQQAQYSVGAAVGLFKSVVSCIMVVTSYFLAEKFAKYRVF